MVALATSVNGEVVAVARENGAIEVWRVAAGSVGWHCHLVRNCIHVLPCKRFLHDGGLGRCFIYL